MAKGQMRSTREKKKPKKDQKDKKSKSVAAAPALGSTQRKPAPPRKK